MFLYPSREAEKIYTALGISQLSTEEILKSIRYTEIPAQYYLDHYDVERLKSSTSPFGWKTPEELPIPENYDYSKAKISALKKEDLQLKKQGKVLFSSFQQTQVENQVAWKAWDIDFSLDLMSGKVLLKKKGVLIQDPEKKDLFLRRIYLESEQNPSLKNVIEAVKKNRAQRGRKY